MKNLIVIAILLVSTGAFAQEKEKTYKLLASCGTCNFDMSNETGCRLAVQIGGKHYWVEGSTLQDHGDEHDPEGGMCKKVRKAKVVGYIKDDKLYASSFILVEPKKKKK